MYLDKYGLYHLKPCPQGEPSGNDGPIVSCYAEKLGHPLNLTKIKNDYWDRLEGRPIPIERLPGKKSPPPSRDTILGWYWLGFLTVSTLASENWNFSPYPLPAFNFFKTLAALWRMRKAHRNQLWMNGGEPHLWRFAFSVPWQDRAYMLRDSKLPVPLRYLIVEKLAALLPKGPSSQMIDWRKYGGELPTES